MADIVVMGDTIPTVTTRDQLFFAGGNVSVTTGLDLSGLASGVSFVSIDSGRTGNIGTISSPLKVDALANDKFVNRASGGTLYIQGDFPAPFGFQQLGSSTTVISGTSAIGAAYILSGSITFGNNVTFALNAMGGRTVSEQGSTTNASLAYGGTHTFRGFVGELEIYGGSVVLDNASKPSDDDLEVVLNGGSLVITRLGSVMANLIWRSGSIDTSALQGPITITNSTINLALPGARQFISDPRITFSNAPTLLFADAV